MVAMVIFSAGPGGQLDLPFGPLRRGGGGRFGAAAQGEPGSGFAFDQANLELGAALAKEEDLREGGLAVEFPRALGISVIPELPGAADFFARV